VRGRVVDGLEGAAVEQRHADGSVSYIPRSTGRLSLARFPESSRDEAEPHVQSLVINHMRMLRPTQLAALAKRFPCAEDLRFAQAAISQLGVVTDQAAAIARKLKITDVTIDLTKEQLQGILDKFMAGERMDTLWIACQKGHKIHSLVAMAKDFGELRNLQFHGCSRSALAELRQEKFPNLLALSVDIESDWLLAAETLAAMKTLQRLTLLGNGTVVDLTFLNSLPNLHSFTLHDAKVERFGPGNPRLRSFKMTSCELVTASCTAGFCKFAKGCAGLETMYLDLWAVEGHPREILEHKCWPPGMMSLRINFRRLKLPPSHRDSDSTLVHLRYLTKIDSVHITVPVGIWTLDTFPAGMGISHCRSLILEGIRLRLTSICDLTRSFRYLQKLETTVGEAFDTQVFTRLENLRHLTLTFQTNKDEIDDTIMTSFPLLPKLRELEIRQFQGKSLISLEALAPGNALRHLSIMQAKRVEKMPRLAVFSRLDYLTLVECRSLTNLSWTHQGGGCGLRSFTLKGCSALTSVSSPCFRDLHTLVLSGSLKLSAFEPVVRAKRCRTLDLSANGSLTSLPHFDSSCILERVTIRSGVRLMDLSGLAACAKSLVYLDIKRCVQLRSIEILRSCRNLREVYLTMCSGIHDVSPLEDCTSLEVVDLSWCSKISKLFSMRSHFSLRKIFLRGALQLPPLELAKLRWLPVALEELRIDDTQHQRIDLQFQSLAFSVMA